MAVLLPVERLSLLTVILWLFNIVISVLSVRIRDTVKLQDCMAWLIVD